ncbi:MAG: FkbM family methyltransferase [Gemmatimonadales bacterium]
MTRIVGQKKPLASRIYRKTGDTVDRFLPSGFKTPAHYLSRRLTHRLEAEYDAIMSMVSAGRTAVDVGANIGIFTYGFLARGADVCAIEPQPACAKQIKSFYDLGFPRVTGPAKRGKLSLHVEAVSDTPGTAVLYVPLKNGRVDDESASLNPDEGESLRIEVPVRRLDDYGLDRVQVIKMDVEGREVPAIEGAADTIARCRPALLVEVEQRHHAENIATVFARIDSILGPRYQTKFLGHDGSLRPLSEFDVERDQLAHNDNPLARSYVRNFFFIPE